MIIGIDGKCVFIFCSNLSFDWLGIWMFDISICGGLVFCLSWEMVFEVEVKFLKGMFLWVRVFLSI